MKTRISLFNIIIKYLYSKRYIASKPHLQGLNHRRYRCSVNTNKKNNLISRMFANCYENKSILFYLTKIDSHLEKFIIHSDYISAYQISGIVGTYPSNIKTINKKISQMTEVHRVLFGMHISGYKYEEIALKMNLPLDSVKKIILFIVEKLESPDTNEQTYI